MLIVLEGMDNTGKTTLSQNLQKFLPHISYTHPVPSQGPEGQSREFMLDSMRWLFKEVEQGRSYVTDRINVVSELIYGPICRGKSLLTEDDYKEYSRRLSLLNPILVYCRPSFGTVIADIRHTYQMDGVIENAAKIYAAYDTFFVEWIERIDIGAYVYDWTMDPSAEGIWEWIQPQLRPQLVKKSMLGR